MYLSSTLKIKYGKSYCTNKEHMGKIKLAVNKPLLDVDKLLLDVDKLSLDVDKMTLDNKILLHSLDEIELYHAAISHKVAVLQLDYNQDKIELKVLENELIIINDQLNTLDQTLNNQLNRVCKLEKKLKVQPKIVE